MAPIDGYVSRRTDHTGLARAGDLLCYHCSARLSFYASRGAAGVLRPLEGEVVVDAPELRLKR